MIRWAAAACAMLLAAALVRADEDRLGNPLQDRFRLTAGVFSTRTATRLRLDADIGLPGTLISAENDFGLRDRSELADIEAQLYLRPRHKLRFGYFQLDRSSRTQLQRPIAFGNQVYLVNDVAEAQLDLSDFGVTYSYLFVRRERFELGASLGLHLVQFEGALRVPARFIEEEERQAAPIPAPGLEATVRLTRRLHAEARFEYLNVNSRDVEGRIRTLQGALFYRFNNNVAAGLGYTRFETDARSENPGDSGRLTFDNEGLKAFFRVSF